MTKRYHQMHGSEEDKVLHSCYTHMIVALEQKSSAYTIRFVPIFRFSLFDFFVLNHLSHDL
jgi:hypothetical protein